MQEDFLHYVWQFKKFNLSSAETVSGLPLNILHFGTPNALSGPDFFNARLEIGEQQWAGNVEIHINSSDWYVHGHEVDPAYDNVILHVVWNHDIEVFRKDNTVVPVLELKNIVHNCSFSKYESLMNGKSTKWINCERDFSAFSDFEMDHWLERLYVERLQERSDIIHKMLQVSSNNWEEVLFRMIAKSFGLNVNAGSFLDMANSLPFSVLRKLRDQKKLEALFLGQVGLLEQESEDVYYQELKQEYAFLKHKYHLDRSGVAPVKFFRLRPDNFPTIRLAQLAALYTRREHLFSEVINTRSLHEMYDLFHVQLSEFWETHYTFQKVHKRRKKQLTRNFIDLLVINTLIPLKFCFAQKQGQENLEEVFELISNIEKEANQTIHHFEMLRPMVASNALKSQALLHLKREFCDKNKCLKCGLGIKLLQGKV
ncbi:DUF2851 family protein [Salinimicrobium sp. GXAS 041]|uniref:DUF2851 family protein n=1 Tax=Salinimicrobium sp. GXAS 041 TaxID=3400806 RepID=UPI003C73A9BB